MSLLAAYIVPHPPLAVPQVGRGKEAEIQATLDGYREVAARIAALAPETIVIISPHTAFFSDWIYLANGSGATGDLAQFGASDVRITLTYDEQFRTALERAAASRDIPAGTVGDEPRPLDHGMMVPLYYVDEAYPADRYQAVSVGGSTLPRETLMEFGRCISLTANALDRRCVLLVSGDLSHKLKEDGPYGLDPAGPVFEEAFERVVEEGDPSGFARLDPQMCDDAAECGLSGFIMMAGALAEERELSDRPFTSQLISHEGPFGVGYGVVAYEFEDGGAKETAGAAVGTANASGSYSEDALVNLAYRTVHSIVKDGATPEPPDLGPSEPKRSGCFVSIHMKDTDELRGCIGTIAPTCDTLAEEIIQNAVSAALRDPRFPPISAEELPRLSINVDVLFPPEPAKVAELDPRRYGVIVTQGFKRGLLLPDLEGVDTPEQQLSIACAKAGISHFGPDVELERFEVVRHI